MGAIPTPVLTEPYYPSAEARLGPASCSRLITSSPDSSLSLLIRLAGKAGGPQWQQACAELPVSSAWRWGMAQHAHKRDMLLRKCEDLAHSLGTLTQNPWMKGNDEACVGAEALGLGCITKDQSMTSRTN